MTKKKYIETENFTLDEWLKAVFSDKRDLFFPSNCFPNDKTREDYLERVKYIPDKEVKNLLRILLQKTERIGKDNFGLHTLISMGKEKVAEALETSEYWKRNFFGKKIVWECTTWILDLLPSFPKEAIRALDAYFYANCLHMTDFQIWGNSDCASIIRAKYFDVEHPRNILLDIEPKEFEWLIEELYDRLGYKTELTPITNDKGIDIIAKKNSIGKKEVAFIQCKRYKGTVGSPFVRDLQGTVTSGKATKGVLIATSEFSKEAIIFADDNPSIELIGYKKLNKLLNMHLGSNWVINMNNIFRYRRQKLSNSKSTATSK